ncbi:hypothetical protein SEUBUCD646_0M02350 [Saccharomyces eubayanus]|uniref:ATPase synthesis protein 25 n=2 Tax=Saccharomyces TaxID=4930 RepID=A0A6C1ED10_SACPS|nr:ATPase synthesis protein 25 mitochondrial [Saccharomyces pastorianus]CAI1636424.1 hypothetical protein SEUBUCD650_0M02330 [Saccharomyces eubayanus]CAI1663958.1 hypothetical protein SEUBUCD646_0M02350 [Saccharomyces eubayanus]
MKRFFLPSFPVRRIYRINIPTGIIFKQRPLVLQSRGAISHYSTQRHNDKAKESDESYSATSTPLETPWYLKIVSDEKASIESKKNADDPAQKTVEIPDDSPHSLKQITDFLSSKLGLTDFLVFDLRNNDPNHISAVNKLGNFMLICTARSTKHCHKSFLELNKFLKRELSSNAYVEGNFNERQESRRKRRLARKSNLSKLWGRSSEGSPKDVNSEAWYMIDCHVDGVFVNILTQKRRDELNLEELYAPEDEKCKFRKKEQNDVSFNSRKDESLEDNNILSGLRRLAQQRRGYSTCSSSEWHDLRKSLQKQDFQEATKIISGIRANEKHNIRILLFVKDCFKDALAQERDVDVTQWKSLFDVHSTLPTVNQAALYWPIRLNFAILLNKANPQIYSDRVFLKDYLLLKKSLGQELTRNDLIALLKIVLKTKHSNHSYFNLVKQNRVLMSGLALFKGVKSETDTSVVYDEQVVSLLLDTMVTDEQVKLRSFYEAIDHICQTYGDNLTTSMIVSILQALAKTKDWIKILQVWEAKIPVAVNGRDTRPWNEFINILIQSGDSHVISKIVNDGHLLWIRRLKVEITPELRNSIKELLKTAGLENSSLEEYLIRETTH